MRILPVLLASVCAIGLPSLSAASPEGDLKTFRDYFKKRFPSIAMKDYVDGVYAIDPVSRETWEAIEEFPPYEPFIEEGEEMWNAKFQNGKGYADCFPDGPAIQNQYPRWDADKKSVQTLPLALNECRQANGENPLKYRRGAIASLLAYIAFESRGQLTDVVVPEGNRAALKAYEAGRASYFGRRGQLNFSCANCHVQNAGMNLRTDILSPALGHTTGWPVYRAKWGNMGTLHRRFAGCNNQVRARYFQAQSEEYRNLEYFLTYMSNGLPLNGPSTRK